MKLFQKSLLIVFSLFYSVLTSAQYFENTTQIVSRNKNKDVPLISVIKAPKNKVPESLKDYNVIVKVDPSSTILPADYKISYHPITLTELKSRGEVILTIVLKKDSLSDRQRKLKLNIQLQQDTIIRESLNIHDTLEITVEEIKCPDAISKDTLTEYGYLAYVGTNLDLVDGVKAKNLFFATSIFLPPKKKVKLDSLKGNLAKRFGSRLAYSSGLFVNLYGNRTLSITDSVIINSRPYERRPLTDSTSVIHNQISEGVRTRHSDNLGAHLQYLFSLYSERKSQLYLVGSTEFIWRRTETAISYSEGEYVDSTIVDSPISAPYQYPNESKTSSNEYSWRFGPGIFFNHENENISIRFYSSVGWIRYYKPEAHFSSFETVYTKDGDIFYSGHLWITEAITGITLQAEVTNTFNDPRPFYVVTLSKAIDYRKIGALLQPITGRN